MSLKVPNDWKLSIERVVMDKQDRSRRVILLCPRTQQLNTVDAYLPSAARCKLPPVKVYTNRLKQFASEYFPTLCNVFSILFFNHAMISQASETYGCDALSWSNILFIIKNINKEVILKHEMAFEKH